MYLSYIGFDGVQCVCAALTMYMCCLPFSLSLSLSYEKRLHGLLATYHILYGSNVNEILVRSRQRSPTETANDIYIHITTNTRRGDTTHTHTLTHTQRICTYTRANSKFLHTLSNNIHIAENNKTRKKRTRFERAKKKRDSRKTKHVIVTKRNQRGTEKSSARARATHR